MRTSLVGLMILGMATLASADVEGLPITVSVDGSFNSKYVWRGINVVDDFVFQPSITLGYGAWSLNFWGNYETTDANTYYGTSTGKNRFTEWDTTLSYSHPFEMGNATFGVIYYDFPNTGFKSTTEIFGSLAMNGAYSPTISFNYDIDEAEGFYAKFSGSKDFQIGDPAGSVVVSGWFGFANNAFNKYYYGNDKTTFADLGLDARYTHSFTESAYGFLSLTYTTLLDKGHLQGSNNRSNLVFGFGGGVKF